MAARLVVIVLVRHGEADGGGRCYGAREDVALTALGVEQARAVAARVGAPARLIVSPARRARQTAALFAAQPSVDPRWAERDFGDWEGRVWADCWAGVSEEVTRDPVRYGAFTPPGGEPLEAVQARVAAALEELAAATEEPVVVVTHGGPIRLALRHALALDLRQTFALSPPTGSATWLRRLGTAWTVTRMGA